MRRLAVLYQRPAPANYDVAHAVIGGEMLPPNLAAVWVAYNRAGIG